MKDEPTKYSGIDIQASLRASPDPPIPDGLADRIIATAVRLPQEHPQEPDAPRSKQPGWAAALAGIAAAIAVALFIAPQLNQPDMATIATAAGETRTINLADGSSITLNGNTQIVLYNGRKRYSELISGEAIFDVRHDESDPFMVKTGEYSLVDMGTIFNVRKNDDDLNVAVSEGLVSIESDASPILVGAGKALAISDGRVGKLIDIELDNVGSWTKGRLVFELAELKAVVEDVSRTTGINIEIVSGLHGQRFSGTILVSEDREQLKETMSQLLGVTVTDTEAGWSISR